MKIELDVVYRNADSGEIDEQTIAVETDDEKLSFMATACEFRPTAQSFITFFKTMYDNSELSGSGAEGNGVLYDQIWAIMSRWAFQKLGWHDVTVDVTGLVVDGDRIPIDDMTIEISDWSLQLVRDEGMYCYN